MDKAGHWLGSVRTGDTSIGPAETTYVVAEAGVNHNGDLALAMVVAVGVRAITVAGSDVLFPSTCR